MYGHGATASALRAAPSGVQSNVPRSTTSATLK